MSEQSGYKKWHKKEWRHLPGEKLYTEIELEQAFNAGTQACAERKDKEIAALQDEIAYLRLFGNEACAAKADEAIKRGTWRIYEKTGESK